ncbi:MAG: LamG domain-containing protein, partial [Verrucomicrobiota bacterium]
MNGADQLAGDADFIRVADAPSLNPAAMTLELWVRSDTPNWNQTGHFISKRNRFVFHPVMASRQVQMYIFDTGWRVVAAHTPPDITAWHHYAAHYDGANGGLHVDGIQQAAGGPFGPMAADNGVMTIGHDDGLAARFLDGAIDEVRVSSVARSTNWLWATWMNIASNDVFNRLGPLEAMGDQPVIATLPPANLSTASVDLVGELMSTGAGPTEVFVAYGASNAGQVFSNWSTVVSLGTNLAVPPVTNSLTVTGLTSGVRYHYNYYAVNPSGSWWGAVQSFVIPGPPMVDNASGAGPLGVGTATLNGRYLDENRGDVTFYWGASDGGTDTGQWDSAASPGPVNAASFTTSLTGLYYGVDYHYRTFADNSYGPAWAGASTNFKTLRPAAVSVAALNPSNVTATSAVLNAAFEGVDSVFDVSVLWGSTDGGTNLLAWSNRVVLGTFTNQGLTNLSHLAMGLASNAPHYYTFMITNCAEVTLAPSVRFGTKGAPGVDNGGGATPGFGETILRANLFTGGVAEVSLFWGSTDGGTDTNQWESSVRLGSRLEGAFASVISGLTYGVQYYYRTYATNSC